MCQASRNKCVCTEVLFKPMQMRVEENSGKSAKHRLLPQRCTAGIAGIIIPDGGIVCVWSIFYVFMRAVNSMATKLCCRVLFFFLFFFYCKHVHWELSCSLMIQNIPKLMPLLCLGCQSCSSDWTRLLTGRMCRPYLWLQCKKWKWKKVKEIKSVRPVKLVRYVEVMVFPLVIWNAPSRDSIWEDSGSASLFLDLCSLELLCCLY